MTGWTERDDALQGLSRRVQRWSLRRDLKAWRERGQGDGGTFGDCASALKVSVDEVAEAVEWHPWMLTHDQDRPLAARRIEHDGE